MEQVTSNLSQKNNRKSFFISTYGCQMNVNDSERMACLLEMDGWAVTSQPEDSDLIIINSCSIREKPVHKVHSEVGRYKKLKQKNPALKIGVTGCVAQQERSKLLKQLPLLDFVLGTDAIDELPSIVRSLEKLPINTNSSKTNSAKINSTKQKPKDPYHIETLLLNPKVTAFVNISKGCDNFCTFCIVPFTRGRERSRPLKHLVEDLKALYDRGVREVTLLGQNVNSYSSECGANFATLLKALARETPIQRIRFTTSHPKDFNEELVDIMLEHRDKIMDYVHLPVQSGNSEILEKMNRGYTREEYIKKAHMILEKMPKAALSTDLIVGFPSETDQQFQDTLSLLDEVPYESLYCFKYSPRPYTKAAYYSDPVPEEVKAQRLFELQEKHKQIALSLAQKYQDCILEVLAEKKDEKTGFLIGRSTQNKLVYFKGNDRDIGETLDIKINKVNTFTFYGDKV